MIRLEVGVAKGATESWAFARDITLSANASRSAASASSKSPPCVLT